MKTFSDIFKKYIDVNKLPASIAESIVTGSNVNSQERSLIIDAECHQLINREDIFQVENLIRQSVLALYSCYFQPHYDSTLFETEYYSQLVLELKRRNASLNGTLNDSIAEIKDKTIFIELKHGGMDFLIKQKFDKNLSELIKNEFGLNFNVSFKGITNVDSESDAYIEKQRHIEEKVIREAQTAQFEHYESMMNTANERKASFERKAVKPTHTSSSVYYVVLFINPFFYFVNRFTKFRDICISAGIFPVIPDIFQPNHGQIFN